MESSVARQSNNNSVNYPTAKAVGLQLA